MMIMIIIMLQGSTGFTGPMPHSIIILRFILIHIYMITSFSMGLGIYGGVGLGFGLGFGFGFGNYYGYDPYYGYNNYWGYDPYYLTTAGTLLFSSTLT